MNLTWGYGADSSNNGNVMTHSITRGSTAFNQSYQYVDPSNRLTSAFETSRWQQTYNYDAFGNRAMPGSYTPNPDQTPAALTEFTVNRWKRGSGDSYDGSGNQTGVASRGNPGVTVGVFTYDGENRMVTSNVANMGTVTYSYDGEGRRVQKSYTCSTGTCTTVFVYDAMGQLASEYSTAPNTVSGTQYLTADSLGSTRLVTDGSGGVTQCYDYLPFGEEIRQGFNGRGSCYPPTGVYPHPADATSMKFTGKERDAETGLDYFRARYMSSAQGRFTSPDPLLNAGRPLNPQSWNRYAYTLNNPLKYVDPDGLWEWGSCQASAELCKAWRERFEAGIRADQAAAASGRLSAEEKKKLDAVLAYLGSANDGNGVKISFGPLKGAAFAEESGNNAIRLDMMKIDGEFVRPDLFRAGINKVDEISGIAIHEGTHGKDASSGVFNFRLRTDTAAHTAADLAKFMEAEKRASENQSLVFKGLNVRSHSDFWNPSWAPADQETLRSKAVNESAQRSVDYIKSELKK